MKRIELTQGYYAIVDDADYDMLSAYSWRVSICKYGEYAVRTQRVSEAPRSERRNVYMHSMIVYCLANMVLHHKNENGLDNRAQNIEPTSRFENWRHSYERTTEAKNESRVPF